MEASTGHCNVTKLVWLFGMRHLCHLGQWLFLRRGLG